MCWWIMPSSSYEVILRVDDESNPLIYIEIILGFYSMAEGWILLNFGELCNQVMSWRKKVMIHDSKPINQGFG